MRSESRTHAAKYPGIRTRVDASGRERHMVNLRRKGKTFTQTYPTLAQAFAGREAALRWMDGEIERPVAPFAPVATSGALTVQAASIRFCKGIVDGSIRHRTGGVYKPGVVRNHESALRLHVLPVIGSWPLATVTTGDVQRLIDGIGHQATPDAARHSLNAFRVVCRHAVSWGEIERNPCKGVRCPTAPPAAPRRILDRDETLRVIAAAEADDAGSAWRPKRSFAGPFVTLDLGSGLRSGELLAVAWGPDGLDLDAGVIHVNWSLDQKKTAEGYVRVAPKSRASRRTVPLPPSVIKRMREHSLATGRPADGELVFPGDDGEPMSAHGQPRAAWRRIVKAAKLAGTQPTIQDLRHTYATHQLAACGSLHVVAELLGHENTDLVSARYGHAMRDDVARSGAGLDAYRTAVSGA